MPANYIQSLSKKYNISVDKLEKVWDRAKELAKDQGREDDFAYITGIFKKYIRNKFNIKENYRYVVKKDNKYEYVELKEEDLSELDLSKIITVGGIGMLLYNLIIKNDSALKKAGLKYGDIVHRKEGDKKISGKIIKKDGIPHVELRGDSGVIYHVRWNEEWGKK